MRRALIMVVFACALAGATQVAGAGAQARYAWTPFHIHLNAYAHWGHCTDKAHGGDARWQSAGKCDGTIEAGNLGTLINYGKYHSGRAEWTWTDTKNNVREFTLQLWPHSIGRFVGTLPDNWHTFTVKGATINGWNWVSGTTAHKGEIDGPLYVDLSSHWYTSGEIMSSGYSLDLRGYLKIHYS